MQTTKVNLTEVIGHLVKATFITNGMFGDVKSTKEGRIVFSVYQGRLMFKEKGARNKGYAITEDGIISVELLRKDKKNHEHYLALYEDRERLIEQEAERQRIEAERIRMDREKAQEEAALRKAMKVQEEIDQAESLPGYSTMKEEIVAFYQENYRGEFFNESFVTTTLSPIAQQIIHKSLPNVNEYPKYYFCKDRMAKFMAFLELKTGLKFGKTQSGNVKILNQYLSQ